MKLKLLIVTLILSGCHSLNRDYVEADLKTYEAVAPDLVQSYFKIEDDLERKIKLNTVRSWESRLNEALKHSDMEGLKKPSNLVTNLMPETR